jgi:hypothetical protein
MRALLANRRFRHLLAAQVVALVGTGLMTVSRWIRLLGLRRARGPKWAA